MNIASQGFNKKALVEQGLKEGLTQAEGLQETFKEKVEEARAEAENIKQMTDAKRAELEEKTAQLEETARNEAEKVKQKVESTQSEIQAGIAENQAKMDAMGDNLVSERVKDGMRSWGERAKIAHKNMKKLKDNAEQAGRVAKDEAKRVHAETSAGILAGTEKESTGGLGANTPMASMSGKSVSMGGRRRRRKSRKKKKNSKRKSRRKKTRKRKSRKSRKKRRKKSKKSRRRRRR